MPFGRWYPWVALGLLLPAAGCESDPGPLTTVVGRVFYKGAPLKRGTIVFSPDEKRGGRGDLARAEIQPDGGYRLRTGDQDGVAEGWYRVTVVAVEAVDGPAGDSDFAVYRSLVPLKYRDPDLSGLDFQVKAGANNTADFHLAD
jgi:hypothetical protein